MGGIVFIETEEDFGPMHGHGTSSGTKRSLFSTNKIGGNLILFSVVENKQNNNLIFSIIFSMIRESEFNRCEAWCEFSEMELIRGKFGPCAIFWSANCKSNGDFSIF